MNTPPAPWTIGYHDGSGNGFRFWRSQDSTQYEYLPVTAQMSSSGIYDGGAAKQGQLDEETAKGLWDKVEALRAATSQHIEAREMGTGAFTITTTTKGEESFIVVNGALLQDFNGYIEALRGKKAANSLP